MTTPPAPRLSATVLLIRDAPRLEVLMVQRHHQIDFASGALVFPGGKAVDDDHDPRWRDICDAPSENPADLAAKIAAVRETFEESGLLLARHSRQRGGAQPLVAQDVTEALDPLRGPVDRGEMSFLRVIQDAGLVLALDTLIHFGHWITPELMPKRFDTHFYIAPAPERQMAVHDGRETTDAIWLEPKTALEMAEREQATIIFPTRMNLDKLSRATSIAHAHQLFAGAPVVSVLPRVDKTESGEPCLRIPSEAGYCQTLELLSRMKV